MPIDPSASAEILIREAGSLWDDPVAAELRLLRALELAPDSEDALIAHYRFLFYRNEWKLALDQALQCVTRGAAELQLAPDWRAADAGGIDFSDPARPRHRFFLFALNASAYLLARLDRGDEAKAILAVLKRLDPQDRIGGGRLLAVLERGPEAEE